MHIGRAACSAAAGGLWHVARLAEVFEFDGRCACQDEAGSLHQVFECPAWDQARREAGFDFHPSFPKCLSYHGLVPAPQLAFPAWPEVQAIDLPGDTLWVDGSGRAPNDSPFRVCSWSVVGKGVLIQARLLGPAQSVRPELLALVTALQGSRLFKGLNRTLW
eukprot:4711786-Amphidinium_carterae.1